MNRHLSISETALLRASPHSIIHSAQRWCYNHSEAKKDETRAVYNDVLKILLQFPRRESASKIFVNSNFTTFKALVGVFTYTENWSEAQ